MLKQVAPPSLKVPSLQGMASAQKLNKIASTVEAKQMLARTRNLLESKAAAYGKVRL